ncbi:hypothetical protein ICN28_00450 [Polynucleobacter sp. 30F-ANTBAC]|uniref:hypothetical protein n=1 Tax=Polynucleobacter sp. 30F-ANTBAC TaxID=2689095 RepID=UPI001C0B804F|nr:hypothetical protein [Polynucleobacter sp. 30F-ANTBAC]MBU3598985.1 hypothetical protein [Polynucleobacter sp. 30F-ANTBAC]
MIQLTAYQEQLKAWVRAEQDSAQLIENFRSLCKEWQLPQKYQDALDQVLSRIESSSLFTEESCSFSKKDLANALGVWLEKAYQFKSG